jgi:hypothetical protein
MADHGGGRHLDDLIDSYLARYSNAEPRLGLEARIVANLRASTVVAAQEGNLWNLWMKGTQWLWKGALVAATVSAAVGVYVSENVSLPKAPVISVARPPALPPAASVHPKHSGKPTGRHRAEQRESIQVAAAGRRDVFPSPTPLSLQERLLLRYLATAQREELVAQSHPDAEILGPYEVSGPASETEATTPFKNTR